MIDLCNHELKLFFNIREGLMIIEIVPQMIEGITKIKRGKSLKIAGKTRELLVEKVFYFMIIFDQNHNLVSKY